MLSMREACHVTERSFRVMIRRILSSIVSCSLIGLMVEFHVHQLHDEEVWMHFVTEILFYSPSTENMPWRPHSCYMGKETCRPVAGSCMKYMKHRQCCCDKLWIEIREFESTFT